MFTQPQNRKIDMIATTDTTALSASALSASALAILGFASMGTCFGTRQTVLVGTPFYGSNPIIGTGPIAEAKHNYSLWETPT